MTLAQAKQIISDSGHIYMSKDDLRRIMTNAYDPIIKKACETIILMTYWKRRVMKYAN